MGDRGRSRSAGQVDDTHAPFRIDRIVRSGLTFVGHQNPRAIRREGEHVRQDAHLHAIENGAVGVEENDLAGVLNAFGFHRNRHDTVHGRDAVHAGAVTGDPD